MNPKNLLDLLPPMPTFSDLAQGSFTEETTTLSGEGASEMSQLKIVAFTDDEFDAALKGAATAAARQLDYSNFEAAVPNLETSAASLPLTAQLESVIPPDEVALSDDSLNQYAQQAALRYTYSLDCLTPVSQDQPESLPSYKDLQPTQRDALFVHLTGHSEIVRDARGNARWLLRVEERRAALRSLLEGAAGTVRLAIAQAQSDAAREAQQTTAEENSEGFADDSYIPKFTGASRVEEMLWSYLDATAPPLENQDSRQLLLTQQVVSWLHELTPELQVPAPQQVARQLARETLLQPFRHLTGEWKGGQFVSYFAGRKTELERLYDYLSVLPPQSVRNFWGRFLSNLLDSSWNFVTRNNGHRPLLIYGLGGVGKSTLLAKFLLDHLTETLPGDRFPYVYLDFDVSALNVREPITMLAEAARQLGEQYPASREKWEAARSEWLAEIRSSEPSADQRSVALQSFVSLLLESESDDARVADQFSRKLPFLLVMDTFEEVQYHDRDSVKDVFRFLNALRAQIPTLHCILMGRAPLDDLQRDFARVEEVVVEGDVFGTGLATDFGVIEVPLGDLNDSEATAYLTNQGVSDSQLAQDLVEVVGGNPLSLRLIARVLREGEINLMSLREEMEWRPTLSDRLLGRKIPPKALLQGVLFRRILGHIHSKKIQDLAHPGLVLRRITPDLIKEVLAEPCGLAPLDDQQALTYFYALAREVSLVGTDTEPSGQNVLRHRPELRRIMLRLMEADETKQNQIQEVHQNAVAYYTDREGQVAQTELLYHCLMLGKAPREEESVDEVPTEEAVEAGYVPAPAADKDPRPVWRALADAAGELPVAANTYIAARIHRDLLLPDAAWEVADPRDFELMILSRTSRRARERSNLVSALVSLRHDREKLSKGDSVLSSLPLIELALLERMGEFDEADKLARQTLKVTSSRESHKKFLPRLFAYNLLAARIAARAGNKKGPERLLIEADETLDKLLITAKPRTTSVAAFRRCERQFLRFATDMFELQPSAKTFNLIANRLERVSESAEALKQFPVLARYVVSSFFTKSAKALDPLPDRVLEVVRKPAMLTALLSRLPKVNANRVARALADWTVESSLKTGRSDVKAFGKLGRPPGSNEPIRIHEYWRRLLLEAPDAVANQLPKILEVQPISDDRLVDFLRALAPEARAEGEDPFEEARRAGDLMPGEGSHLAPNSSRSKQKK